MPDGNRDSSLGSNPVYRPNTRHNYIFAKPNDRLGICRVVFLEGEPSPVSLKMPGVG